MESPPSSTTWSEAFVLSDDSGLLLTNSSISSGSMSGDSRSGPNRLHIEDSDCEEKSFSQDSLDGMSDIMCGENFNTLKKGPNWMDYSLKHSSPIEPPLEFQDKPPSDILDSFFDQFASQILSKAFEEYKDIELRRMKILNYFHRPSHHLLLGRPYYTSEFISYSPCHGRPGSRSSLGSSRLSSSHNSLSVPAAHKVDDSSFITQAVSHDTLSSNQISDLYNVPFDSDMYAVPVDVIKPPLKPKRHQQNKKRRRNTSSGCREIEARQCRIISSKKNTLKAERYHWCLHKENKRHSVAGTSAPIEGEPIHMTLQEVRHYLQTLYSSSSDSSDHKERSCRPKHPLIITENKYTTEQNNSPVKRETICAANTNGRTKKSTFLINIKNKKVKDSCDNVGKQINISQTSKPDKRKKTPAKLFSFKQTLCNMFRFKRFLSPEHVKCDVSDVQEKSNYISNASLAEETHNNISCRALPPLPFKEEEKADEQILDFATSIQRVKDYGWYWGPLPSEVAEKILSNEPDGSFIVRDSSDDHYIFSLTFKLNNCVRHVRIDHDQGNFSFGSCTKFKSQTIVEFIENAVEHSRSGRYLFFLHRRPVIGPVRVQLLHPVSRFKQVQSLQHICRFAIHKVVRRDLIPSLPLPRRMIDYLNTPHYYSEHLIDVEDTSNEQVPPRIPTPAIRRDYQEEEVQAPIVSNVPLNNYVVLNNTNPRQS
ncbi:uncharacterized protein LOC123015071 [Tribolium madens]|uniref:uncharacterized protein LOC123015071 n=1 Tax=Tribolium madens TaxID=41895 RepID=UPI001CF75BF0|nr:uncharacterized protein LOC123015071 [Tribolium madens]XP_044270459.1 uncharacterized protein LOC123015071 [Tribolium madens]